MKCPNCNETLLMTERHNVEIDYCPSCRGVWLDKGELDKMLEYVGSKYASANPMQQSPPQAGEHRRQKYDDDYKHDKHGKPYRKKSFLGDLFDFD